MTPLLASGSRADRAFERMYRRHVGDVYRYAFAVLRNQSDAEDVTQTTFLNAYRAFQRGERPEKAQNWLIRIAHNVCRQRFRQAARRPNEVAFDEDFAEAVPLDTDVPSAQDLTRALSLLAFNQRSALVMRELEGRSYVEIAHALGLSVSAVETLLFRARRALREQLEGGLTCRDAELAISRQVDGRLPRPERGPLRAHLRECNECASFARSQRAQRSAWKGLAAIPLPSSLASFFGGGGGAAVGTGAAAAGFSLTAKASAVVVAAALAGGVGFESVRHSPWRSKAEKVVQKTAPSTEFASQARAVLRSPAPEAAPQWTAAAAVVKRAVKASQRTKPSTANVHKKKLAKPRLSPPGQAKKALRALARRTALPRASAKHGNRIGLVRSERAARNTTKTRQKLLSPVRSEQRAQKTKVPALVKKKQRAKVLGSRGGKAKKAEKQGPSAAPSTVAPAKAEKGDNGNGGGSKEK